MRSRWRSASAATSGSRGTAAQLRPVAIAVAAGGLAWLAMEAWAPDGRVATLLAIVVLGAPGAGGRTPALCGCIGAVPPSAPMMPGARSAMSRRRAVALGSGRRSAVPRAGAPSAAAGTGSRRGRVLVLSLPALSWDELYQGDTPALDALLDESAVGAMSVRDVRAATPRRATATPR